MCKLGRLTGPTKTISCRLTILRRELQQRQGDDGNLTGYGGDYGEKYLLDLEKRGLQKTV